MKHDNQGIEVSTNSPDEIEVINRFNHQLVSNGSDIIFILDAAKIYPDNFLIQCFAATFNLFVQEPEFTLAATSILKKTAAQLDCVNPREKQFHQALQAWSKLDYENAINSLIAITTEWPTDCTSVKLAEWLFYCTGQKYQGKRFLAMCENIQAHNQDNCYFLATYAFALELAGEYDKSYEIANKALAINPRTAWAHHAISHVQLMRGQIGNSVQFLETYQPTWEDVAPPLRCHNTWHLGLLYIADRNHDKSSQLYKNYIWCEFPDTIWQQIESSSYLWRMEMAGIKHDSKWDTIANHIGQHVYYHDVPFSNMHFIYALIKADKRDEALNAIEKISIDIQSLSQAEIKRWQQVAIPLLKGIAAFADESYAKAAEYLAPVMNGSEFYAIGGSDAQCEIVAETYYLSLLHSKNKKSADDIARRYLAHYENTAMNDYWKTLVTS